MAFDLLNLIKALQGSDAADGFACMDHGYPHDMRLALKGLRKTIAVSP